MVGGREYREKITKLLIKTARNKFEQSIFAKCRSRTPLFIYLVIRHLAFTL